MSDLVAPDQTPPAHSSLSVQHPFVRGWSIVGVAFVGLMFSVAPLVIYTFGVFVKPLAAAFHTNRASVAGAVSLVDVMIAVTAWVAGSWVDRYGARVVIVSSIVALSACLIGLALTQPPVWHLYALYALAGMLGVASAPVSYGRVVANWFDRGRGLALGVAGAGVGLGAFLSPPFAQFLVDHTGWRGAYVGLAVVSVAVAGPVVALFLRGTPEEVGLRPDGRPPGVMASTRETPVTGMTVGEALRTRVFWQLAAIFFLVGGCVNGTIAHLVPLLTDRHIAASTAALGTSLFGLASIAGRTVNGYLVDRFFAPRVVAVLFTGAALGVVILLAGGLEGSAPLVAALLGLAIGAEADAMPFMISRYFGMRAMAELYGCAFGAYTVGNATGRYLFDVGFDHTGSYRLALGVALVAMLVAIIGTLALGPYRGLRDREVIGRP